MARGTHLKTTVQSVYCQRYPSFSSESFSNTFITAWSIESVLSNFVFSLIKSNLTTLTLKKYSLWTLTWFSLFTWNIPKHLIKFLSVSFFPSYITLVLMMSIFHLSSHLTNRYQIVTANGHRWDPIEAISDVPQGSVLGPSLFLLFINDLPAIFIDSSPLLFAGDLKILFTSCNFQDDLTRLYNWNLANGMLANHTETKTLSFKGVIVVDCEMGTLENV